MQSIHTKRVATQYSIFALQFNRIVKSLKPNIKLCLQHEFKNVKLQEYPAFELEHFAPKMIMLYSYDGLKAVSDNEVKEKLGKVKPNNLETKKYSFIKGGECKLLNIGHILTLTGTDLMEDYEAVGFILSLLQKNIKSSVQKFFFQTNKDEVEVPEALTQAFPDYYAKSEQSHIERKKREEAAAKKAEKIKELRAIAEKLRVTPETLGDTAKVKTSIKSVDYKIGELEPETAEMLGVKVEEKAPQKVIKKKGRPKKVAEAAKSE